MRVLAFALLLLVTMAGSGWADDDGLPPASDRAAIRQVINDQIAAFRRDDGPTAFGLAAPSIQAMFGDAGHFMAMVQRAYPPVYRPRAVTFGSVATVNGELVQTVELVGPDGAPKTALYTMEREPDGTWRIDGCALIASQSVGA